MAEGDPLQENLERIKKFQSGVQDVWEKIPLPDPYRKVVSSWVSLEVMLLVIVGAFVGGPVAAVTSPWFLAPSAVLLLMHAWWLVREIRSARRVSAPPLAGEKCHCAGCPNKPMILGFCAAHAARARGCYRLLESYGEDNSDCFFGRDTMIGEVLGAVVGHTLTLLVGESGVGKSSLLQAGLNPALPGLDGGGYWPVYINCRDVANDPVADLDVKCGPVAEGAPALIELDQFEQLFVRFPAQVGGVIGWIKRQLDDGQRVLIAMRRDYVDDIDAYQDDLPDIFHNRLRLLRFTPAQAGEVVAKSAQYAGVNFPDDLRARIIEDLAGEPVTAPEARISPAELQIVCSRLVAGTSDVTLTDYRRRGGRVGLVEEFLLDTVDRFPAGDRQVVRHVLFELARRSPTVSQRIDVPTLAKTSPQPERVAPVLKRLDELGFVNRRQDDPDGLVVTYELTHEYLIPLIRRFVHETHLDYYQCKLYFDQMLIEERDGATPPLGRLLHVSLRLFDTLTEPDRLALRRLWRRSLVRRVVPAGVAAVVGLGAAVFLLNHVRHTYFLAADLASRTKAEVSAVVPRFGDGPESRERIPIVVNRGVPWLPFTIAGGWDSGYFLDELSDAGNQALKASPRVPNEGRAMEHIMEGLLASFKDRTMILVNTGRAREAIDLLRGAIEAGPVPDAWADIYLALAAIGSKEAASMMVARYEASHDRREQKTILQVLWSLGPPEGDEPLAKALESDKVRLGDRLAFLHQVGYDLRPFVRRASALKRLAGSRSEPLRGIANLALGQCGMPCDYDALRALRSAIQKDSTSFDETDSFGMETSHELLRETSIVLCTESLANCIEEAPSLADGLDSIGTSGEARYPFGRGAAVLRGLQKALDEPKAARRLLEFVLADPKAPKADAVCNVLFHAGGRHVADDLLAHLAAVAPIPAAMKLLRYAGPDALKENRDALAAQARLAGLDVQSRLYASLALVRIEDPAGYEALRAVLSDPGWSTVVRENGFFPLSPLEAQARGQAQARYLIGAEIMNNPEAFLILKDRLPSLGPELLWARAAMGDRTVITELIPEISTPFTDRSVNTALARIEGPELYRALAQRTVSEQSQERNDVVSLLAALQGRERIEMLLNMALDSRNYFGTYNGMKIGESAIAAMRTDRYPDDSVLALVRVAESGNPDARKAARTSAGSFVKLMDRVEEANVKALRGRSGSPYEDTRSVAVQLLSRRSNPSDLEWLEARLGDPSPIVKEQAAKALGGLKKRGAIDLLDHPSWSVRSGAAAGLAEVAVADPALIAELDAFEKTKGGKVSRPVWEIRARAKQGPVPAPPIVMVRFKELKSE